MNAFLLAPEFPDLATEIAKGLDTCGEPALASTVATLEVLSRCRCGDSFCATMYTGPQPDGPYGPSHRNIEVSRGWAGLAIDGLTDPEHPLRPIWTVGFVVGGLLFGALALQPRHASRQPPPVSRF